MSVKGKFFKWLASSKQFSKQELTAIKKAYDAEQKKAKIYSIMSPEVAERMNVDGRLELFCQFLRGEPVNKDCTVRRPADVWGDEAMLARQEQSSYAANGEDVSINELSAAEDGVLTDDVSVAVEDASVDGQSAIDGGSLVEEESVETTGDDDVAESRSGYFGGDEKKNGEDDAQDGRSSADGAGVFYKYLVEIKKEIEELIEYKKDDGCKGYRLDATEEGSIVFDIVSGQVCGLRSKKIVPMARFVEFTGANGVTALERVEDKSFPYHPDMAPMFCSANDLSENGRRALISKSIDAFLAENNVNEGSTMICLIPDTVGDFGDHVKRQLSLYRKTPGIVPIPRSIAAAYAHYAKDPSPATLDIYDFDLPVPSFTVVEITEDNGQPVFIRKIRRKMAAVDEKCTTVGILKKYAELYCKKKGVDCSAEIVKNLVSTRDILSPVNKQGDLLISLKADGGYFTIGYDADVLKECVDVYSRLNRKTDNGKCKCAIVDIDIGDNRYFSLADLAEGCSAIVERIREGSRIWVEYLPSLSLEVIKEGRFEKLSLINEKQSQDITADSMSDEVEIPVTGGRFVIPKGVDRVDLPLTRDEFGVDLRDKLAQFSGKIFPLSVDKTVDLQLRFTFGEPDSYQLTAVAVDDPDFVVHSKWVDVDEESKRNEERAVVYPEYDENGQIYIDSSDIWKIDGWLRAIENRIAKVIDGKYKLDVVDNGFVESNIILNQYGNRMYGVNLFKKATETANYAGEVKNIVENFLNSDAFYDMAEYLVSFGETRLKSLATSSQLKKALDVSLLDFMSELGAVWSQEGDGYYGEYLDALLERFEKEARGGRPDYMVGASRCISYRKNYMHNLAQVSVNCLSSGVEANKEKLLRNISAVCWYNSNWMFDFVHADARIAKLLEKAIKDYFSPSIADGNKKVSKAESEFVNKTLKVRDIMEVALALCRIRVEDASIFDPDDRSVRDMVIALKNIDNLAREKKYMLKKPFVSRVKFDSTAKGALFALSDPCFLLISQLTGMTGIKLLGFEEEKN